MSEKNKKIIKITAGIAPIILVLTILILRHGSLSTHMIIAIIAITFTLPLFLLCLYANVKKIKGANLWLTLTFLTILLACCISILDSYLTSKGISNNYLTVFSPSIVLLLLFFVFMSTKTQYSLEKRNQLKKKLVIPIIGFSIFQIIMIYGAFFKSK